MYNLRDRPGKMPNVKQAYRVFVWIFFGLALVAGCQPLGSESTDLPLTLARRSVLDQKIRMLTLQFGDDLLAAYDLENARLQKIWRGGVLWNGAAFNNMKTVQPESYGTAFWEYAGADNSWWIGLGEERLPADLSFRAYRIDGTAIAIEYLLRDERGHQLTLTEKPVFQRAEPGFVFQRKFGLSEKDQHLKVFYGEELVPSSGELTVIQARKDIPAVSPPKSNASSNNSQYWLERSGCNTCHDQTEKEIGPSYEAIAANYEPNKATIQQLSEKVKQGGSGQWGNVAMIPHPNLEEADIQRMVQYILSLRPQIEGKAASRPKAVSEETTEPQKPGFGIPLEAVHPTFDLINFRPDWFRPRVGGMAFLPDGRLLVSTWDSIGAVYALSGLETGDSSQIEIQQIAGGLSEPLGLTTVGEDIFVLQKHELTQLIDLDGDGITDEYRLVNDHFAATPDFHEYSYGLLYRDGAFYGGLGLAMRLMSHELQLPDRGTIFKMKDTGEFEILATGLRQPNGLVFSPEGELFVVENQGQWVPSCKIIHIEEGKFYGCQFGTGDRFADRTASPPAVWLPQDEIGNSPSQPLFMKTGPYRGQMIYGEVTHGGIKRVFLEKVNGAYQGCVFRFSQGLEAGINRMAWGPDDALYVGGVGMNGNWTHRGKQFGLQKLVFNEQLPFELLAIRSRPDGFELEFTEPVAGEIGSNINIMINIQQWHYEATAAYGGPKLDLQDLKIDSAEFSPDRKKLYLAISGLQEGYVIYFALSPQLRSQSDQPLWSGDAWYTLNQKQTVF